MLTWCWGLLLLLLCVPPSAMVAGRVAWVGAWVLGGLGWLFLFLKNTKSSPPGFWAWWRRQFARQPYGAMGVLGLWLVAAWWGFPLWGVMAWVCLKAWGVAALAFGVLWLLGLWALGHAHRWPHRRWLVRWLVVCAVLLLFRTLFGPQAARGLDLPIPIGFWVITVALGAWGLLAQPPRWLFLLAWTNVFFTTVIVEFYCQPLHHQHRWVSGQPGVTLIGADPKLDFRWITEGCAPGRYWMGVKDPSRVGVRYTLMRQDGKKWRVGGLTADNGVVDCNLKMLVVGDQDSGGGLAVLDEKTARVIKKIRGRHTPAEAFSFGFSGLDWLPGRGLLLAGKEKADEVFFVSLKDPFKPEIKMLPVHATFLHFCRQSAGLCAFGVAPGVLHRFAGEGLARHDSRHDLSPTLGPDLALDEAAGLVHVTDHLWGRLRTWRAATLRPVAVRRVPVGVRYLLHWPATGKTWLADYLGGWFYSLDQEGRLKKEFFAGRKTRWLNLSRDGKSLLWCAASACYRYTPQGGGS